MKVTLTSVSLGVAGCLALVAGCQDTQRTTVQKPVIEESQSEPMQDARDAAEEAGEDVSDAASDAIDAVTPDRPIADIETPIGDVEVGEDPVTGDTNVDVDSDRADVDVSDRE